MAARTVHQRARRAVEAWQQQRAAPAMPPDPSPAPIARARMRSMATGAWSVSGSGVDPRVLLGLDRDPRHRMMDPFAGHPWVFSAAVAIATAAAQAPFVVYRETEDEKQKRAAIARKRWPTDPLRWVPRSGRHRRALQRHMHGSLSARVRRKGLEPDWDHPLYDLLQRPNPLQAGNELMIQTLLWMSIREAVWILTDSRNGALPMDRAGNPMPERIWCVEPHRLTPVFKHGGDQGPLVAWRFLVPNWWREDLSTPVEITLPLEQVVRFKLPGLESPLVALARLTGALDAVGADKLISAFERALLENGGRPSGLLLYKQPLNDDDIAKTRQAFEQRHSGVQNAGRVAVIDNAEEIDYKDLGQSPQELQNREARDWNREEVLAVMGTPRAVLGVPDQNYATQLGQQQGWWAHTILPMLELIETVLDRTLFFPTTDDVIGAFDLKDVSALKVELDFKLDIAAKLMREGHAPPDVAYRAAGLEIERYEGDDVALVQAMLVPLRDVLDPPELLAPPPFPPPNTPPPPAGENDADAESESEQVPAERGFITRSSRVKAANRAARHRAFLRVQGRVEGSMRRNYRAWVGSEKRLVLAAFDAAMAEKGMRLADVVLRRQPETIRAVVLGALRDGNKRLTHRVRPVYVSALEPTFELTAADLGGVPTFALDDPSILGALERRQTKLSDTVPETLRHNLDATMAQAIANAETVQQMRQRVAQVFDVSAGSAKSLMVARTESAGLMNSVRDEMFGLQGVERHEWSTAGDEHVRESHVVYGAAGPQPRGFNWLELTGGGGTLAYPGDPSAPAGEVVNCRCTSLPTE
jgi:phage portal protein BeeE